MSQARIVQLQVIVTDSLVGDGTQAKPFDRQAELWTTDGRLLAWYVHGAGEGGATPLIAALEVET